jgi:uncharacterized protein
VSPLKLQDSTEDHNMDEKEKLEVDALHERMLRKQLWVIIAERVAPPAEVGMHLKAHLEYQISLEKQGVMYGAGPASLPGESAPAFGLIIIRAKTFEEAKSIADNDPMTIAGVRTYKLYQWSLNEGRISITLDFSDRTYQFN